MQKARIRLTGTDYEKVEMVCDRIREIAERTGVNLAGPIPLPTKKLLVPIRKSPDGEGTAVGITFALENHGMPPGLLSPVSWAIAGKVKEALTKDLGDMKKSVEA